MRRIRRRALACWWALGLSSLLHLFAMLTLSAALRPIDLGHVGKLLLTAELASEAPKMDSIEIAAPEIAIAELGPSALALSDNLAFQGNDGEGNLSLDASIFAPPLPVAELPENLATEIAPLAIPERQLRQRKGRRNASAAGLQASFFGTVAYGDVFVYVLDISGSMSGTRFERARDELVRSVGSLQESQSFYVLLFNDSTRRMFDEVSLLGEAAPASNENKRKLRDWLSKVSPGGGTDPREALRIGLGLRPSALYLLSDGQFQLQGLKSNRRLRHGESTIFEMFGKRRRDKIPIHTFAYESQAAAATMQSLSLLTGGEYRFIAAGTLQSADAAQAGNGIMPIIKTPALLTQVRLLESRASVEPPLEDR